MKCDKCGKPFGGKTRGRLYGHHCKCCGVLGRDGLRTVCDCGAAWSEYVVKLVASLRKRAEATRCCFAGVGSACPIHEK